MTSGPKIFIYGDSIMKGTVMDSDLNYHFTMEENITRFSSDYNLDIANKSRFGHTVDKGRRLIERDIELGAGCKYALIEFGGNDCDYKWNEISDDPDAEHKPRTELDRFSQIYRGLIDTLKKASIIPVIMTLPPIDAEKYFDFISRRGNWKNILKWLGDKQMIYRFHELYSNTVAQIADQTKTLIIDVRSKFLDKHNFKNLIGPDGIHPDKEGYALILSALKDFIEQQELLGSNPLAV